MREDWGGPMPSYREIQQGRKEGNVAPSLPRKGSKDLVEEKTTFI